MTAPAMRWLGDGWRHAVTLLLAGVVAAVVMPPAVRAADAATPRRYDIPAQPLSQALATFARASGIDLFYEAGLAAGLRSTAVAGRYSGATALGALLGGTGLRARFTGPRAAIVFAAARAPAAAVRSAATPSLRLDMAQVRAPILIGRPDNAAFDAYARLVQQDIRLLLSGNSGLRGGAFQLALTVRVDRGGRIVAVTLAPGSTSATATDIRARLSGHVLPTPPPDGLTQPFRFEVSATRLGAARAP